jgi:hypothetical protein
MPMRGDCVLFSGLWLQKPRQIGAPYHFWGNLPPAQIRTYFTPARDARESE